MFEVSVIKDTVRVMVRILGLRLRLGLGSVLGAAVRDDDFLGEANVRYRGGKCLAIVWRTDTESTAQTNAMSLKVHYTMTTQAADGEGVSTRPQALPLTYFFHRRLDGICPVVWVSTHVLLFITDNCCSGPSSEVGQPCVCIYVHREAEKRTNFLLCASSVIFDRNLCEFFHVNQGKYRLQFRIFNFGMR